MPFLRLRTPRSPGPVARRRRRHDNPPVTPEAPDTDALTQAQRIVRSHREGVLLADDAARRRKFIIDPERGDLVLRVLHAEIDSADPVLHVPEEEHPGAASASVELLIALVPLDPERDFVCDRHAAAHPRESAPVFARARLRAARLARTVLDPEDLRLASTIRAREAELLRRLNSDAAALRRACLRAAGVEVESPVAVAVDQHGFDARASFGVVRVEFGREARGADEALAMIESLLGTDA